MMSVSPGMGSGRAAGYFSREDYYLKGVQTGENSRWVGEGAKSLGLSGAVGEEEFRALCRGEDPAGRRIVVPRLSRDPESGELVESHRAGNDCTFSAPKSVSIAYVAGGEGIKEAHDAAVFSVLEHMERHYCHYRAPEGILNGTMVAAKFDHATSRNVDPQLHSHVFILNVVRTGEGGFKANEPRAIFQDQGSLGLLYRQALARELTVRGIGVEILDRDRMFFELKGVDPLLVEYFSSRRREIESQVALWRDEGKFAEVPHARLYEMAALGTRNYKREMTREDVERIFERGFEACGSSIERVRLDLEEARRLELSREEGVSLREPAARAVELAVRELAGREAVLDRARLLDRAVRVSGGAHTVHDLDLAIEEGAGGLIRVGEGRGREYYTTVEMRELEARNLARFRELAEAPFSLSVERPELAEKVRRLAPDSLRPTAGQARLIENELAGGSALAVTVGDPGTGKTYALGICDQYNESVLKPGGRGFVSLNLSYTAKAAREMGLATGRPAFTVDSFLNGWTASKFELQRQNSGPAILEAAGEKILILEGAALIIRVDEASLLGARQAGLLLDAAYGLRERGVQVKLHLLGDSKQMQAIQAGDTLRQLQELGARRELEYAHLTEILRQRDPELLEIARGLNREDRPLGENAREALLALEKGGRVVELSDPDALRGAAVERYLEESRKPSRLPGRQVARERQQVLLVTPTNAERRELNREIRQARVAAGEIGEGERFTVLAPVRQELTVEGYRLGDTVLFTGERREDGRLSRWGARINTEGRVTSLDRERNSVEVSYSFTRKRDGVTRSVTREFSAAELSGRSMLYREEERSFAIGDRIVTLKNDRRLKLQNGSLGVIRELDRSGRALVDLGDREVAIDLKKYRQVDHAYAVTIHKSQGATVEHSILYAPVRPRIDHAMEREPEPALELEAFGRTSYNALNVAVTRAQFDTHIFTNSLENLTRSVQLVDEKSSTLRKVPGRDRELFSERAGRERGGDGPEGLEGKIRELGRSVAAPGEGMRKLRLDNLRLQLMPPPLRELKRPLQLPEVQRDLGRQLELALPRKSIGLELSK